VGGKPRTPAPAAPTAWGLLNTIEIRLPLSPRHALLMTWSDKPDDVDAIVEGNKDHARRFNAFTIAAAGETGLTRAPGSPLGGSQSAGTTGPAQQRRRTPHQR
jgi:hypothetical protein